jgi:putative transposase
MVIRRKICKGGVDMECIKTVKFKIKVSDKSFNDTISIYNEALSYIINIINDEWNTVSTLPSVEE